MCQLYQATTNPKKKSTSSFLRLIKIRYPANFLLGTFKGANTES